MAAHVLLISDRPGDGARVKLLNNLVAGVSLIAGAAALAAGWSDKDDCVVLEVAWGKAGDVPLAVSS
jgi:3-hydroxyisobutyrate dehydrogenase-like beta-hydroxyacid dehydrogenase